VTTLISHLAVACGSQPTKTPQLAQDRRGVHPARRPDDRDVAAAATGAIEPDVLTAQWR
jgi:hypothetical protein